MPPAPRATGYLVLVSVKLRQLSCLNKRAMPTFISQKRQLRIVQPAPVTPRTNDAPVVITLKINIMMDGVSVGVAELDLSDMVASSPDDNESSGELEKEKRFNE